MFPLGHARVNFGNEVNFRSFSGLKNLIKCVFLILLRELMHHPLIEAKKHNGCSLKIEKCTAAKKWENSCLVLLKL